MCDPSIWLQFYALSTPVLDINFGNSSQYYGGLFQSGSNASTWAPYNSPDADDPYPIKNRGLYFNGLSYLLSQTSPILNSQFSLSFWFYNKNNDQYIWIKNTLGFQGTRLIIFQIQGAAESFYLQSNTVVYTNNNVWQFNAYSCSFVSETYQITQTVNMVQSIIFSINGFTFYDYASRTTIGTSWVGFLYTITLWQSAITDFSSQYNICGSGLAGSCLWNCDYTDYYSSYYNTCMSCNSACASGFSTWNTCAQCQDLTCSTCTNYNLSCSSTASNPCFSSLTVTSSGYCCNASCGSCFGPLFSNCIACNNPNFLLGQICISTCPLGYTSVNLLCSITVNPIITLTLDSIQDKVTDSSSGIIFSTGIDTNFYPNGGINDPIPAIQRGYYFTSTSYMTSSLFIMPYNFTIMLYIKHVIRGIILSKDLFTISTQSSLLFSITSVISASFSSIPKSDWNIIGFQLSTNIEGTTTCLLIYPQIAGSGGSFSINNTIFIDSNSNLILGAASGSFQGFIYNFTIYSSLETLSTFFITKCASSGNTACLWNCNLPYFLYGNTCTSCSSSCTNGCRRSSDCNLCQDIECSICSSFSSICTTCASNAYLNSTLCACNPTYYWDTSTNLCQKCFAGCASCTGNSYNQCTSCVANATLSNNACICNTGYYLNSTVCSSCNPTCYTCIGGLATDCSACSANSTLQSNYACTCNTGYYWSGASCLACDPTCSSCSGQLSNQCLACPSNSILQSNNSCRCSTGYYWSGTSCLVCNPTCSTCAGGLATDCSTCPANSVLQANYSCGCNISYYLSGVSCYPCNLICLNCIGPLATECLTCPLNSFLQVNNSCGCNAGYYRVGNACMPCNLKCLNCTGPLDTECSVCPLSSFLQSSNSCICNAGYYWSGTSCLTCNATCLNCTGPSDTECSACPLNSFLQANNTCTCNQGFYWSGASCLICNTTCLNCTGPSDTQCSACPLNSFLWADSACTCNQGYYWSGNSSILNCIECTLPYILVDSLCICGNGSYYNLSTKFCDNCTSLCNKCSSQYTCESCTGNSTFNNIALQCECNAGYSGNNSCSRNSFTVWMRVNQNNTIALYFTEPLKNSLNSTSISIILSEKAVDYQIFQINTSTYELIIDFTTDVNSKSILTITFLDSFESINGSLLVIKPLTTHVYIDAIIAQQRQKSIQSQAVAANSLASTSTEIAGGTILGISLTHLELSPIFNFMNTAEMFYVVYLFNLDLYPVLSGFLTGMRIQSKLPNIFSYFFDESQGISMGYKHKKFGYSTNLILLNIGVHFTTFLCTLAIYILTELLSKNSWLKSKLESFIKLFKYGAFLSFWTQTYFEFSFASSLCLSYYSFENISQIFSLIFCVLIIVRYN